MTDRDKVFLSRIESYLEKKNDRIEELEDMQKDSSDYIAELESKLAEALLERGKDA
jgi:predicted transcriptional regulator